MEDNGLDEKSTRYDLGMGVIGLSCGFCGEIIVGLDIS